MTPIQQFFIDNADLFRRLTPDEASALRAVLADGALEGWEPTRDDLLRLVEQASAAVAV